MTTALIDAPPIARLRAMYEASEDRFCHAYVLIDDLAYALARVDESCAGCVLVEALATQARNLDRLYAMIDELMAERRGTAMCRCGGAEPSHSTPAVEADRADFWTEKGIGG